MGRRFPVSPCVLPCFHPLTTERIEAMPVLTNTPVPEVPPGYDLCGSSAARPGLEWTNVFSKIIENEGGEEIISLYKIPSPF